MASRRSSKGYWRQPCLATDRFADLVACRRSQSAGTPQIGDAAGNASQRLSRLAQAPSMNSTIGRWSDSACGC
jgi:hypothetical protein